MENKSIDGQRSFKANWPNASVISSQSTNNWSPSSMPGRWMQNKPVTSKYEIILQALETQNTVNTRKVHSDDRNQSQTNRSRIEYSQKLVALILPLVLMGIFLAVVVVCHRIDAIRNRRGREKPKSKGAKTQKIIANEQAVEEVDHETDVIMLQLCRLGKHKPLACEDIGQNKVSRCVCTLERCAHCLGYDTKKIQWQGTLFLQGATGRATRNFEGRG